MAPVERIFSALDGAGLVDGDRASWSGKFGSLDCTVCGERGGMYWGEYAGKPVLGCRNKCDRIDIAHSLGLTAYDIARVVPKFIWNKMIHWGK